MLWVCECVCAFVLLHQLSILKLIPYSRTVIDAYLLCACVWVDVSQSSPKCHSISLMPSSMCNAFHFELHHHLDCTIFEMVDYRVCVLFIEQTLLPMALSGYRVWQEVLLTANLMKITSDWAEQKSALGNVPVMMKQFF